MNREVIDSIINEEINKVITEDFMGEDHRGDIANLINGFLKHHRHRKPKQKKKLRKLANGGKEYYDYDAYEHTNQKMSKGDASTISNNIDTEKTNMAAIARELFPDHTEEGAQSQFRKIINGERPMTKRIASKIEKMIAAGEIAVK